MRKSKPIESSEQLVVVSGTPIDPSTPTKVKFGAFTAPTPKVWKTAFKLTSVITTVVAFWVKDTSIIAESFKVETLLILKGLDMLVFGIGRAFGVVPDEKQDNNS